MTSTIIIDKLTAPSCVVSLGTTTFNEGDQGTATLQKNKSVTFTMVADSLNAINRYPVTNEYFYVKPIAEVFDSIKRDRVTIRYRKFVKFVITCRKVGGELIIPQGFCNKYAVTKSMTPLLKENITLENKPAYEWMTFEFSSPEHAWFESQLPDGFNFVSSPSENIFTHKVRLDQFIEGRTVTAKCDPLRQSLAEVTMSITRKDGTVYNRSVDDWGQQSGRKEFTFAVNVSNGDTPYGGQLTKVNTTVYELLGDAYMQFYAGSLQVPQLGQTFTYGEAPSVNGRVQIPVDTIDGNMIYHIDIPHNNELHNILVGIAVQDDNGNYVVLGLERDDANGTIEINGAETGNYYPGNAKFKVIDDPDLNDPNIQYVRNAGSVDDMVEFRIPKISEVWENITEILVYMYEAELGTAAIGEGFTVS